MMGEKKTGYFKKTKRMLDILGSIIVLMLTAPITFATALAIRLTMGRPVLFKQERTGFNASVFTLYKFRTMIDEHDSQGNLLSDAERLTGLGRLLRSYSIDELPELLNVLKGDISLVGPRPLLESYIPRYSPQQMRRHEVLPGMTGWAQVNGRNAITWEEKFVLDVWYVDNCSLQLDIKILMMTLRGIIKREGISQAGQATMEEFK